MPSTDRAAFPLSNRAFGPLGLAALAIALMAVAAASVALTPPTSGVAPWWPAAGLSALALAWAPRDRRAVVAVVVLLAMTLANLLGGRALGTSLGLGLADTAESAVVAWVLAWRARSPRVPRLTEVDDVGRLVAATVLGILVMGLGAGLTVWAMTGDGFAITARTVMASHGAAILVVVPLGMRTLPVRPVARWPEVVAQVATLTAFVAVAFAPGRSLPLAFTTFPVLVWAALRFGVRPAATQLCALGLAVVSLTWLGGGPLAAAFGAGSLVTIAVSQAYLVCASVVVLPLAVSIARLRSSYAQVGASERLFRQGFADALLGTVLLRRCEQAGQGGLHHVEHHGVGLDVVEVNDVAARMLGLTPDQLSGTSFTERLQSGDRPLIADAVEAIGTGAVQGWHGELALPGGDGTRWIEVALSPLSAPAGDGLFVAQMVDVTARRAAEERLTVAALHDALTGLANRTLLRDRIDLALATLPDDGSGVAVLFCDLDDFKRVNDSAGHSSGDVVLVEVAARLRAMLRPDDVAARLGGDEFVILRPHVADVSHADALAGSVLESLARPLLVGGQVTTMGASIGIAWGVQGATADDLLRDADAAMYAAKASGKRRAVVYADEHRTRALRAVRVEAELRTALDRGELEMYLQPVVEVLGGQVVAAEALVRWRHPEQGVLAPAAWLDVAEGSGLMPQLGEWVLRRSCEMARTWPCAPGGQALVVHVNVSARQLEVPGFVDLVRAVLDETGLPPASLTLEFTETYLEEVTSALVADLNSLRSMGVGLAADDFGTGYSPLTRILETPLTMIKIDRRFVSSMLDDARSGAVVRALLRLGESLGIAVVAEGVETQAEAHALATLGCRHAQGYLWSRPLPPEAFVQWLATDEARLAGVRAIGAAHADGATHLGAATHPGSAVRLSPRASG